ncbi:MAG: nucleotide exchange factor GrpE [Thermoplasmata archaeon]|nr:nucleotide exchange factor GrpE [Thermoplasmata archaeon]
MKKGKVKEAKVPDIQDIPEVVEELPDDSDIEPETIIIDFEDKWKRALADLDNMRKRTDRELEHLRKYSSELLILDMIRSMEDMERALDMSKANKDDMTKGLGMVLNEMNVTLKKHGVEIIESMGASFDPNLHEALMQECTDCIDDDDKIIVELQRGYKLHDRVIRHAKVKVGKYTKGGQINE